VIERAGTEKLEGKTHRAYAKNQNDSQAFITKAVGSSSGVAGAVIKHTDPETLHGLENIGLATGKIQ